MTKNTYMIRKEGPSAYIVLKFDNLGDYEGSYRLVEGKRGGVYCDCPYGSRKQNFGKPCRHTAMLRIFKKKKAIDKAMYYCYDSGIWGENADVC